VEPFAERVNRGQSPLTSNGKAHDARQVEMLRRLLGMAFQQFNLWTHRTLIENVMAGTLQSVYDLIGRTE